MFYVLYRSELYCFKCEKEKKYIHVHVGLSKVNHFDIIRSNAFVSVQCVCLKGLLILFFLNKTISVQVINLFVT